MYQKQSKQLGFEEFYIPFGGYLHDNNRWVQLSGLIPWDDLEHTYAKAFSAGKGAPSKPFRMALGAVVLQKLLGVSDREIVELITENHYMQYFIGLEAYQDAAPFAASLLVQFRRRLGDEVVKAVFKIIHKRMRKQFETN
ncbi:MAG: transposase [Spirochaetia bacterium]|nr:transposase [Spirochaetia bacterium]